MTNTNIIDIFNGDKNASLSGWNEYSVNLPAQFCHEERIFNGCINVLDPFRATIVSGDAGRGKTFSVVNNYIKQLIEKGFSMYIYDYKFPDLTEVAFNHFRLYPNGYKNGVLPKFYAINFNDLRKSHRCNPIHPSFMKNIDDAYQSACSIMLNLDNYCWPLKQDHVFVKLQIAMLTGIIWYLKRYKNARYCTFPHAIELMSKTYADILPILTSDPEIKTYLSPYLYTEYRTNGQIEARPISMKMFDLSLRSKKLYWIMTGNDFTLDINNPQEPKIICIGGNPQNQENLVAALGLYTFCIGMLTKRKNPVKSAIIIDELPTIYFHGISSLMATAGIREVALCFGYQDFRQLSRNYNDKTLKIIQNTVGNIFSGNPHGEQGVFSGSVSNSSGAGQSSFTNAKIVVDIEKNKANEKRYISLPTVTSFVDEEGEVDANFRQIKSDVEQIIKSESAGIF
jgi:hypothetical protein